MLSGAMSRERAAGLPESDWRKHDPRFNEPQLSRNLELVERLKTVADRHETTPGAVAVAWSLHNPAVDGAIVGFRRPDQVDPILTAAGLELTEHDIDEIEGATPGARLDLLVWERWAAESPDVSWTPEIRCTGLI
jgi:aryl-alcohol dehydrogenase-like predicted oxidoreductase